MERKLCTGNFYIQGLLSVVVYRTKKAADPQFILNGSAEIQDQDSWFFLKKTK
jgi:hypothetical protein